MAIKSYNKGQANKLSDNFTSREFDCHGNGCCYYTQIDSKLVDYLQKIRNYFDKPLRINSGYRCPSHNSRVGGSSKSVHMNGGAADIRVEGVSPIEVARYAEYLGMLGIGVYNSFTHVDTRQSKYFWYDGGQSNVKTFGGQDKFGPKEEEQKQDNKPKEPFQFYTVKITAILLNVRSGPSTKYKVINQVKQNQIFTILEEKDGWGRIPGDGWISLKYTEEHGVG